MDWKDGKYLLGGFWHNQPLPLKCSCLANLFWSLSVSIHTQFVQIWQDESTTWTQNRCRHKIGEFGWVCVMVKFSKVLAHLTALAHKELHKLFCKWALVSIAWLLVLKTAIWRLTIPLYCGVFGLVYSIWIWSCCATSSTCFKFSLLLSQQMILEVWW